MSPTKTVLSEKERRARNILLATAALTVVLVATFAFCLDAERRIDQAYASRLQTRELSTELIHSSDHLTRLARTYVITGDPAYRRSYEEILAIRDGKMERPLEFWRPYWDLKLGDGPPPRPGSGRTLPLLDAMRQAGFQDEEFRLLEAAKSNSDALTAAEFKAMTLVESAPRDGAARARARAMLFDAAYHQAKAGIMKPIDNFISLADARTLAEVESSRSRARLMWWLFGATGTGLLVMLRLSYLALLDNQQERERAQEQLRESERRFRQTIEAVGDYAIITLDEEGRVASWNSGAAGVYGFQTDDILGQHYSRFFLPEDIAKGRPAANRAAAAASGRLAEDRWRQRKDGAKFLASTVLTAVKDEAGTLRGFSEITRDMTEREKAEELLRQKTAILEAQLLSTKDGILVVDPDRNYILKNPRFAELWQIPEWVLSDPDKTAVLRFAADRTKDPERFVARVEQLYRHPNETLSDEVELSDGTFLDRYTAPISDRTGRHIGRIWVFRDVTARKRVERERETLQTQLQQSQKMDSIGRLAGGVAHDFNNLLTAITNYAQFVRDGLPDDDPKRADVGEILAASEKATALTRQLLAFSRRQFLAPRALDMNETLGGMVKALARLVGENIKVQTRFAPQPCLALVDAGQIDQVVLNLAANARDAMPRNGTLTLETAIVVPDAGSAAGPGRRMVCVTVRDTGVGMTEDVKAHLFEPFFTTKAMGKGPGLGLSMVYGIIKQSGGSIEVESAPGKGTAFRVFLPMAEIEGAAGSKEEAKGLLPRGKETILLVDDEEYMRVLGARILSTAGYTVLTAGGGEAALELLAKRGSPVDVLVTDMAMPRMSGRELAERVSARGLARKTLFVSGSPDELNAQLGTLKPGMAFLTKPFSASEIQMKVREVLDGSAS